MTVEISQRSELERIDLRRDRGMYELGFLQEDDELFDAVDHCCAVQSRVASAAIEAFEASPLAARDVSEGALEELLRSGVDRSDLVTDEEVCGSFVFHNANSPMSIFRPEVVAARERVDQVVERRLRAFFPGERVRPRISGHLLYPPGGHMGWHTNTRVPGWRLYIVRVPEPGQSFFRYRDPATGQIVTAWDRERSVRLFRVEVERPFWHAVHSETHRASFGYRVDAPPPRRPRLLAPLARWLRRRSSPGKREG